MCKDASNSNQAYGVINRQEGKIRPAIGTTTGPPKNDMGQSEVGECPKGSKRIIKIYRANRVDDKKGDEMMCWRRMRRGAQDEGNGRLRKMCKDRYVLICVSFSVLNAAVKRIG